MATLTVLTFPTADGAEEGARLVQDRVIEAVKCHTFEIIAMNLSQEEEQKLRDAFAEE